MSGNTGTIVNTRSGKIEGTLEDQIFTFRGVPYAASPVGNLRWLPPQPLTPWEGVRPAKEFGAISPQNRMLGGEVIPIYIEYIQRENHHKNKDPKTYPH